MSGSGKILSMWATNEPASNKPAIGIETDYAGSARTFANSIANCVYLKPSKLTPAIGDLIEWGPNHIKWHQSNKVAIVLDKLGNSFNRDDPLH